MHSMETLTAPHLTDMPNIARQVLARVPADERRASVLTFSGELGAGKTTLVQHIAQELGIGGAVTSPTFVIMKQYVTANGTGYDTLVHIDAYRIADPAEMEVLGFLRLLEQPRTLICIEWPEHIATLIPSTTLRFILSEAGEGRTITIHGQETN